MKYALVAAADVTHGAMIALVPSAPDLERLVLRGGEPLDQLHLTLLYLGDADQIEEATRDELRDWARDVVVGWSSVEADAFAPALFNPTGPEPCAVLVCSGSDLAEFYETTLADVSDIINLPDDMHLPWIPHITLTYEMGLDLGEMIKRTGPVVFDRLRLAFGGEVLDVPFKTPAVPAPDAAVDETQDEPAGSTGLEPGPSVAVASAMQVPIQSTREALHGREAILTRAQGYVSASERYAHGEREVFDGCLRCFGPAHDGQCPPAL